MTEDSGHEAKVTEAIVEQSTSLPQAEIPGAILAQSTNLPPPQMMNLNFQLTPEQFNSFMSGDYKPIVELIRATAPKKPIVKLFGSWKDIKRNKDKVAIIGFADSRTEAPYNDPEYEIWGLNSLFENIPMDHVTRWFEIHDRKLFAMDTNKEVGLGLTRDGKPYMEALGRLPCPVYMINDYPDIATCVRYPIEDMISEFDPQQRRTEWKEPFSTSAKLDWNGYFTNSISYMIALAIYSGYKTIAVYGVDMATGNWWENMGNNNAEYYFQRPSCEYYLGIAVGRGIKIEIPSSADLLKARFNYGIEQIPDMLWAVKVNKLMKSMTDRMNQSQQNIMFNQKQVDQYIGANECAKELHKIWGACVYDKKFYDAMEKWLKDNPDAMKVL